MKNIKIKVRSPEHSEQIQKVLFALGFSWSFDNQEYNFTDKTFLYTDMSDMALRHSSIENEPFLITRVRH